jgi:hypothetical protein
MPTLRKLDTIEKLKALKPGEKFIYYKGNFEVDIAASSGQYRRLLEALQRSAQKRANERKVHLLVTPVQIKKGRRVVSYNEYSAIGAS